MSQACFGDVVVIAEKEDVLPFQKALIREEEGYVVRDTKKMPGNIRHRQLAERKYWWFEGGRKPDNYYPKEPKDGCKVNV